MCGRACCPSVCGDMVITGAAGQVTGHLVALVVFLVSLPGD